MKLTQLHFTRFIAAISIVIFHSVNSVEPFSHGILNRLFTNANVGVSYFFVLSGFVMVIAYGRHLSVKINATDYYLNRFARIYPVYIIALASVILIMLIRHQSMPMVPLFLQTTLLQAWLPVSIFELNVPGWSLSVEAFFYLLFPLLFNLVYSRFKLQYIAVFAALFWLTTQILSNQLFYSNFYQGLYSLSHGLIFYSPAMHLNEFMVGNVLGLLFWKIAYKRGNYDWLLVGLFIVLSILLLFTGNLIVHNGGMAIIFAPLILVLALNTGKISALFSNKYLVILGEASYAIYILQVPVKTVCSILLNRLQITNETIVFYIFLVVLIAVSIACHYLIELPLRVWIKNCDKRHLR